MSTESPSQWPELFPQDDVPIIVQDVLDACKYLKSLPFGVKRPEEYLSRKIYAYLRFLPRYRSGPLEPHFESPLPDLDGRTDIRFSCGKGIDTYFVFEAKRLFVTFPRGSQDTLIKEYVDDGMMRFVSGKYAPFQKSSAMLGYVFDCDIIIARNAVSEHVRKSSQALCLETQLTPSKLPVIPPVDQTRHSLDEKRLFVIYHLFVKIPARKIPDV